MISAKYSKAELHEAREKLIRSGKPMDIPSQTTSAATRITSIAPAVDGSGLEIGYDEDRGLGKRDLVDPLPKATREQKTNEVKAATDQLTGLDTHIFYQPLSQDLSSRQADTSPWWGGAGLQTPGGGICSSGFGVTRNQGGTKLLTAAYHCDGYSGQWSTWGSGVHIGHSTGCALGDVDTVGILPDSGSTGGYVYDGAANDSTGYAKPVSGWGHNNVGDYVCTSGANSGVHCNVVIQQTDIGITGPNGIYRPITDLATQVQTWASNIAAADGDSGGPVFATANGATTDVARGTITANKYTINCPSGLFLEDSSKACYGGTYFVPIYQTLSEMNWSINIG